VLIGLFQTLREIPMQHLFRLPRCLLISSISSGTKPTICSHAHNFRPHYWQTFLSLNMSPKASTAWLCLLHLRYSIPEISACTPLRYADSAKPTPRQLSTSFCKLPSQTQLLALNLRVIFSAGQAPSPADEIGSVLTSFCSSK
jgi:hypothetical protein